MTELIVLSNTLYPMPLLCVVSFHQVEWIAILIWLKKWKEQGKKKNKGMGERREKGVDPIGANLLYSDHFV
jgi:hypothetical protein